MPRSRSRRGSAYVAASGGIVAWNAVSKTATCGTPGSRRRASRSAATAGVMCSGASSVSPLSCRSTSSSTTIGSRNREPPWTIRCATASTPRGAASSDSSAAAAPPSPTSASFRLVEPALTTRTAATRRSGGPGPVADLRRVLAALTAVRTRLEPPVDHLLAHMVGLPREPGQPVDHVDDEVEAVEVVEHDHVERRRRRAFLLVAAHVEVRVVLAAVGEAVDQPRVAVVGEDDGAVGREQG